MKQSILSLVLAFLFSPALFAQTLQATIVPGSAPNSILIKVRSKTNATTPAVPISTVNFSLQLRDTLPLPKPTLSVTEILPATAVGTYTVTDVSSETPGYYTWNIDGTDGTTVTTWAANEEITFIEFFFNGGPLATTYARMVHLPDGGLTGASTFYLSIGGVPQIIESELFYGTTAVNNTAGVYPGGTAYVTLAGVVLPVKFLGFSASRKDNNAILTWQIENETSVTDRYEVERSLNGQDFKKIDVVNPKKNGNSANNYDYTEYNLSSIKAGGVIYYRIRQVDKDGKFTLTGIRSIRLDNKNIEIGVYPNPIKNIATLYLDLLKDSRVTLTINDASGKQVQNIPMQLFKGVNRKDINMSGLAAGNYMLKVNTGEEVKTISLVKTN